MMLLLYASKQRVPEHILTSCNEHGTHVSAVGLQHQHHVAVFIVIAIITTRNQIAAKHEFQTHQQRG